MTTVHVSGPIFDGIAAHEVEQFSVDAAQQVAQQAYADWMTFLNSSIRHPTPYYETQVNVHEEDPHRRVVNDRGIIYGPWLEGVGSRNSPVTRFPGYFSLRRGVQETRGKAPSLLKRLLEPFLERMRGDG